MAEVAIEGGLAAARGVEAHFVGAADGPVSLQAWDKLHVTISIQRPNRRHQSLHDYLDVAQEADLLRLAP